MPPSVTDTATIQHEVSKKDLKFKHDPDEPLMKTISKIPPEQYQEWVHKPRFYSKSLYLFAQSGFFEFNSHTKWYFVPIAWIPIVMYHFYYAYTMNTISAVQWPIIMLAGYLTWGLLEYSLHCWAFHVNTSSVLWNKLHFIMHGIHHYAPADPDRLVFPPIPGILFVYIPLSTLISYIITNPTAFHLYCASATIGYIMYDMIHFYLHHGKNFVGPFKYLKACHNHHHFFPNGEQHNYGISFAGKLVDFIMGTDHFPTKTVRSNSTA